MKKQSSLLDRMLFAPGRYLTRDGDIVGATRTENILNRPETRAGIGMAVGLTALFSVLNNENGLQYAASGAAAVFAAAVITDRKIKPPHSSRGYTEFYFDTGPDRPIRNTDPAVKCIIRTKAKQLPLHTPFNIAGSMVGGIAVATATSPENGVIAGGVFLAESIANGVYNSLRSQRVLDGEWNVLNRLEKAQCDTRTAQASGARSFSV